MRILIAILRAVLYVMGLLNSSEFRYSRNLEGNFRYMGLGEKLWWAYKALVRQVENAEKGKDIEEYFKTQNLSFSNDTGFEEESRLLITAGGDLSCSEVIDPSSTAHLWDDVKDFYFSGDIVCANLEAPIDCTKPSSGVPRVCLTAPALNMAPEMFEIFTGYGKGINFFSTANNHSLDQGEYGLAATLDFLDSRGYRHTGTSRTAEEQMDVVVVEKNGIRTAFLSYTFSLNGFDPVPGREYMTNLIRLNKPDSDISLIKEHVKSARAQKADVVVAMLHWSIEFETYPLKNVMQMGHKIMECGVDIILGGHPHVAQPMEKYSWRDPSTGLDKEGFIIYSLGELASYNAFSSNSRLAMLVGIDIVKGRIEGVECTNIAGIKVLPIYTLVRKLKNGSWDYRLLDFIKVTKLLEAGSNPYGLNKKEKKEFERLKTLLYSRLLPEKYDDILIEADIGGTNGNGGISKSGKLTAGANTF